MRQMPQISIDISERKSSVQVLRKDFQGYWCKRISDSKRGARFSPLHRLIRDVFGQIILYWSRRNVKWKAIKLLWSYLSQCSQLAFCFRYSSMHSFCSCFYQLASLGALAESQTVRNAHSSQLLSAHTAERGWPKEIYFVHLVEGQFKEQVTAISGKIASRVDRKRREHIMSCQRMKIAQALKPGCWVPLQPKHAL